MPRSARTAILAACLICEESGEVPGGLKALHACLGHDAEESTLRAVQQAESWGYLKRPLKPPGALVVVLSRLVPDTCGTCGRPGIQRGHRKARDGKPPECHHCRQNLARSDRAWRGLALQTWAAAKAQGLTEGQTLHRVQAMTGIRLYGSTDSEIKAGEQIKPGLVAWMVEEGLLDAKWLTYAARTRGRPLEVRGVVAREVDEDGLEG
jgi:hypothetical protein